MMAAMVVVVLHTVIVLVAAHCSLPDVGFL
jgi:hypothetical protein